MVHPKSLSLWLIAFTSLNAVTAQFDPPDLNAERQLHQQFLKSQRTGQPLSAEEARIEDYRLRSGEDLKKLSQILYGDSSYWPKVWAQNPAGVNPHLVRPGHKLQFRMGSEDQPPAFRFSEDVEDPVRGLTLVADGADGEEQPQVEIPPPEEPPRPVINVPKSFPAWQEVYRKPPDSFKIDYSGIKRDVLKSSEAMYLQGYIQEKEISSAGSFLETEAQSALPVEMQYVYVKMNPGAAQIGQTFVIVKDMGRVKKTNNLVEERLNARLIRVYGEIEITDRIQDKARTSKFEIFRALVTKAIDLTLTDFQLVPGRLQTITLNLDGPRGTVNTQIIGSYKHQASIIYGPGDVVFLNKGSRQGVTHGQILNVYVNRMSRNPRAAVTNSPVPSGQVKVVKVDDNVSTAVIVKATDAFQQGDFVQEQAQAISVDTAKDPDEYYESEPDADSIEE